MEYIWSACIFLFKTYLMTRIYANLCYVKEEVIGKWNLIEKNKKKQKTTSTFLFATDPLQLLLQLFPHGLRTIVQLGLLLGVKLLKPL